MDGVRTGNARESEVHSVKDLITSAVGKSTEQMAPFLAEKADGELFGQGELELRDLLFGAGQRALEALLEDRKKGGTRAAGRSAPPAGQVLDLLGGVTGTLWVCQAPFACR
jgi:hypothetical protein